MCNVVCRLTNHCTIDHCTITTASLCVFLALFVCRFYYTPKGHITPCLPRSRGSTLRTKARPLGSDTGATHAGNVMAARCAVLLCIAAARGLFWILEQPKNSLFQFHPCVQSVLQILECYRKPINMGDYGALTQKPTWLYSGHAYINDLDKFRPVRLPKKEGKHELVVCYYDSKGVARIKGSKFLKASQAYPPAFFVLVCQHFLVMTFAGCILPHL